MPVPGIDEQPILRRHRREIGRAFVCACFALFMMLSLAVPAVAEGERYVVPGNEVVVSFPRSPTSRGAARSISRLKVPKHLRLEPVKGSHSIGVASVATSVVAQSTAPVLVNDAEISAVCSSIRRANPNVEVLCEANTLFFADIVPNDPDYSSLYGLDIINAPAAWNHSTGLSSVVVAVLDTGVDYQHPDLSANIHTNALEVPNNGIDDDGNGYIDDYYGFDFAYDDSNPMDVHGHGTHCAGTIGARGNNAIGIVGVNWEVGILPVKVLRDTGSGYLSDIAAGIDFAVARGASVISMSLSGSSTSATMETAIQNALNQDVLVVAAAGNNATNNDTTPRYPASSTKANVVAVAATDESDALAYFSNYGLTSVDLAAPGVSILSTLPGNTYDSWSGTSMATPHVAGLAALLKAVDSSLTYSEVKDALFSTVDPLAALTGKCVTGGRINAAAAVQSVMPITTATATVTATATRTATSTATPTPTPTATATPSFTHTTIPTPSATSTPSFTATSIPGSTETPLAATPTPASSLTPAPVASSTPSATPTALHTFTATKTPGVIETPEPTSTNTPAPSPTAPPTRTSPSVPTATPTPAVGDSPPETITEPNNITFFIQRERRRAYLFGEVTDSDDQPVIGLRVLLVCGGREIASVLTEEEGYYEFIRRRPSRPINCYVKDADEGRSKTRKLR